ncbi:MAG TPA: glycosyltransferase [Syntrophales bacterium]|nr:glycosyltransferase [Syntrophales bacterium]
MAKISCIMIVKDEEHCLERCLKSVRDYVDEIVIVDTGSSDRSVEIALSFGARVYHHPWENDFSLHRNQSISYATGDWLLQMDADEELFPGDGLPLRELAESKTADYYFCIIQDMEKDGKMHGVFNSIRFFRKSLGMHYVRRVHEQLLTRGRGAFSRIRIRHYGYDLDREKMERKHLRTTTLLKKMIEENPEDPFNYFELAASYSMHRDFEEAVSYGEKALKIRKERGLKDHYFFTAFYIVAQGYFALGNLPEAKRACLEALNCFADHLDCCHILAAIYFHEQDWENCHLYSQRYLELHDKFGRDPSLMGTFYLHSCEKKHEIYLGLGWIELAEGRLAKAEEYFRLSYDISPDKEIWAQHIARFYLKEGLLDAALPWLYLTWREKPPSILMDNPHLFVPLARHAIAKDNLPKAEEIISFIPAEGKTQKLVLSATVAWRRGEIEEMVPLLSTLIQEKAVSTIQVLNDLDDLARILYDLTETLCLRGEWQAAPDALILAVEIAPHLFDPQRFSRFFTPNSVH